MTLKLSRNGACPCGSGRKYKRCCFPADEVLGDSAACSSGGFPTRGPTITFTVFGPDSGLNEEAVADTMKSYKMAMFEHWLDDPRPDFGGLSARQAAEEPQFRRVLEGEIAFMETAEATVVTPEHRTDLSFLREALGLQPARQVS